jgi:DNA-binding MarR family transcriptional regulator
MQQNVPTTLLAQERSFSHVRGMVAKVLLEHAGDGTTERPRLTLRAIAEMMGTDWETVHMSLKSLQDEGAIRIGHQRIIAKKELLQSFARTR